MHSSGYSNDAKPSREQLRLAFDEIVSQYLCPAAIGLGVLYVIFAMAHWAWLPQSAKTAMTAIASASALVLFAVAICLRRWHWPVSWAHPIAAGLTAVVLVNILSHVYFTASPRETTNLILVIIGTGFVFLSTKWLVAVLTVAISGWALVTSLLVGDSFLAFIDFGTLSATVLATILHSGRLQTCKRLEELRLRDRERTGELQAALFSAERELVERRRIEARLEQARDELELRVQERTAELGKTNAFLRTEIAEREKAEAQLRHSQKMDAIGQLAAGVAHDFNNMLTVIQGHASCLENRSINDEQKSELLREISEAAERAASLTRQLLVFSRKQIMQLRHLDLNELTQNLARMLGRILGEHIALQLEQTPQLPGIDADPGMIEQVLLNLAVNARDAMPAGGELSIGTSVISLDSGGVRIHGAGRTGEWVRLTVRDSGSGIDPALLPRIFEPFFTTKPIGKGAGLGLSTVYGIVKQHKGWIDVSSELGHGTTFHIHFPAVPLQNETAAEQNKTQRIPGGTECILVVEDEPAVRQLACRFLRESGYKILDADSGVSAVQVWANNLAQIDLLLTDLVMPGGLSGRQLAERCLAEKPNLRVVYTSGYSTDFADLEISLREGHRFLPKPYRFDDLARTIRESLDSRRPA